MKLRHFDTPQDALVYIQSELLATLEQDLERMEGPERGFYSTEDRREMRNRIADLRKVMPRLTLA